MEAKSVEETQGANRKLFDLKLLRETKVYERALRKRHWKLSRKDS